MTSFKRQQRLELTWFNKDKSLIPTENGKYGYSWVSPQDPRYCQTRPLVLGETIEGVQAPKREGAVYSPQADLAPTTDNLLINGESGDVLEALTRVPELADKYLGKVKLCYIDPPFNTAKTFEHYEDNLEHSIWLTMMRDRLLHIKKLLAPEGSIWVHLDDSENHRMRVLMDEVFGPGNFVAEIAWEKADSPRANAQGFSSSYDVLTVYRKTASFVPARLADEGSTAHYKSVDNEGRKYNSLLLRKTGSNSRREDRPTMWFPITAPSGEKVWPIKPDGSEGRWRWRKDNVESNYSSLEWLDKGYGLQPYVKSYLNESRTNPPTTWWPNDEVGHNRSAKAEIKTLFPGVDPFDTPKPERLLERIIHIATGPGDIVLDVFAGSGTTAAVAHKMGRRWVTCELLESTLETFTLPRLEKIVRGEDWGGITSTEGERVDATEDGLPGDLSGPEAFVLTQALGKIAKIVTAPVDLSKVVREAVRSDSKADEPMLDGDEAKELRRLIQKLAGSDSAETDFLPYVHKSAGAQLKTRKSPDTINWRGGGSFRIAHLAPECFDSDPELGLVTLTPDALDGDYLERSVAAHLNFHLTPGHPVFTGIRGRTRLIVIRSAATSDLMAEIVSHLGDGEKVIIAATAVDPDFSQALRKARKGSRVLHIPADLFRIDEIEG